MTSIVGEIGSGVSTLIAWWIENLVSILPSQFGGSPQRRTDAVLIETRRNGLFVSVRRQEIITPIGHLISGPASQTVVERALAALPAQRSNILLSLQPEHVLRKTVSVPVAARRDLSQLLAFEMDRETPYSTDEVFWTFSIGRPAQPAGHLDVEMMLVPKHLVSDLIEKATLAGLPPSAIEANLEPPKDGQAAIQIPLDDSLGLSPFNMRRASSILGILAIVLAVVAVVLPLGLQALELGNVDAALAIAKEAAEPALAMRNRDGNETTRIFASYGDHADPLAVLAAASTAVPDNGYLTELNLHGRSVAVTGKSLSATRVLGAFADTPLFTEPRFTAATTRSENGSENFSLAADVSPEPLP